MEDLPAPDIYLDWLDLAAAPAFTGVTGRLGMTLLPGRRCPGQTAKQPRDIEQDARTLAALGVRVFVLLVEDHEMIACGVTTFSTVLASQTPRERSRAPRPLSGRGTPEPGDVATFTEFVEEVGRRLQQGQTIGVSCRGGLGRTGTFAACLLKWAGLDADTAIAVVRRTRPGAVENARQVAFIRAW